MGDSCVALLSTEIVRIECAKKDGFFDGDTFFVPDRGRFSGFSEYAVRTEKEGTYIEFSDKELFLPAEKNSLRGVTLRDGTGKLLYRCGKLNNTGELPPLGKTPEVFALADIPRIRIPEGGYTYRGRKACSGYVVEECAQDLYLLLCGKDAKKLRRQYVELTGRTPLVRLSTLGAWNSKYYKYNEESAKQVILDYEKYDVPLDNMVIDTDWRAASDRGIGYDIDTQLFPDMKRFFDFAHAHGVEIMFNDHPEPVDGAQDVFDPKEVRYREEKLQGLMELGLDTWWYDRNWHTKLNSPSKRVLPETFGLYLFEEITKHFYEKKASGNAPRRPVLMGNIVNIIHGIYQSINDSASHRFGIQWTGDIASDEHSLAREAETLVRASDNCIPYVNADCGGHVGNPDKELYLRWIQFGVLSPVFRPHCTNYVSRFREPWLYDEDTLNISREYIKMRYRLLPVIYREAYKAYVTGEPIFRGLGWEYPHEKRALNAVGEYMLGRNILIAPVTGNRMRSLEQSRYCTKVKGVFYDGTRWEGDPIAEKEFLKLDMDLNGDSPCSGVPAYNFSAQFETTVKFERDVDLFLRCDDGATVYVDGEMVFKDDTMHSVRIFSLCLLKGGEEHKVVVRYFQAGGEASCGLYYAEAEGVNPTYLPAGKWLDVFSGKIRKGGIQFAEKCDYDKMPLFVRLGALIPLAYDAKNTKEQKWDRLAFDYYPDKEAFDADSLYEDDGETTAYQNGAYRISPYKACYDEQEKCYIICFEHSEGDFSGDRFVTEREITLRFHRICKEKVFSVTLNGEEIEYKTFARDRAVFPFAAEGGARDSEGIIVRFRTNVSEENKIKFFMSK